MLFDGIPFSQLDPNGPPNLRNKAIRSVFDLLERKFGVTINYDLRQLPFGRPDLVEGLKLGERLVEHGVISSFSPGMAFPDEPQLALWSATCRDREDSMVGGAAWKNDQQALMATLAEGLERYIWWQEHDHFIAPVRSSSRNMARHGAYVAPGRFAGFSEKQRNENHSWKFDDSTPFLWTRGTSLVTGKKTYLPAQTVSGIRSAALFAKEPLIRQRTTIGLATWPTREGALLAGALEVIEREAYMTMWLNQLSLPRIALPSVTANDPGLAEFASACERYGLKVHAIKLLTDAPTHAVCVVIEDMSGHAPRFSFGLKAHRSLPLAIEKAMTEALRARLAYRRRSLRGGPKWDPTTPTNKIGHMDRIFYWGIPENAKRLEFLISGEEQQAAETPWENDTPQEHLARVVGWCKKSGFECVSVSLGASKKNPTRFAIEMVVIPELQPTYLSEELQQLGGERWKTIPRHFGLKERPEPFSATPHPFA